METETANLTVRRYTAEDYPLVNDWWQARHGAAEDLAAGMLPPLGAIVEDAEGPLCALWCCEVFGVGIGYLEWPVSRPGLTVARALGAFEFAIQSLVKLAGKCCDPPGEYKCFRATPDPVLFRAMRKLGFVRESPDERIPVILIIE